MGLAVEKGLRLWGGPRRAAIKGYARFIADGMEQGHREEYYEVKLQRYLGDDEFVEAVERALERDEEDRPVKITMAEVVQEIIRESGQDIAAILSKGRGRIGSRLRAEAVYAARETGGSP
jgi:hypothetical protein